MIIFGSLLAAAGAVAKISFTLKQATKPIRPQKMILTIKVVKGDHLANFTKDEYKFRAPQLFSNRLLSEATYFQRHLFKHDVFPTHFR